MDQDEKVIQEIESGELEKLNKEKKLRGLTEKLKLSESAAVVARSLASSIKEDEFGNIWYGCKKVENEKDLMDSFWCLVEAAGKAADVEWALKKAGRPQTSGGTYFDTKETPPLPGIHLWLTNEAFDGGEHEDQYYTYWSGESFPATKDGLEKAIIAAENAKTLDDVTEGSLNISWKDYLPGKVKEYCDSLVEWKRKE